MNEQDKFVIEPIAYLRGDFKTPFAIPRQAGIAKDIISTIEFTGKYRNPDAIRGIEGFSHLYLIWQFSENVEKNKTFNATVRPPRLGGNKRVGVFASRAPFRPNSLGISIVKLIEIKETRDKGNILIVSGADLMDGTPIFDIKPYLPEFDSIPEAKGGFTEDNPFRTYEVEVSKEAKNIIPEEKMAEIIQALSNDARPAYHENEDRVYGVNIAGIDIKFKISKGKVVIVC
jgi:tRNA-Thr(GGU) m(6)t(6)A37 methyltransferase TsaA